MGAGVLKKDLCQGNKKVWNMLKFMIKSVNLKCEKKCLKKNEKAASKRPLNQWKCGQSNMEIRIDNV